MKLEFYIHELSHEIKIDIWKLKTDDAIQTDEDAILY